MTYSIELDGVLTAEQFTNFQEAREAARDYLAALYLSNNPDTTWPRIKFVLDSAPKETK